jgi:hypothetical protein
MHKQRQASRCDFQSTARRVSQKAQKNQLARFQIRIARLRVVAIIMIVRENLIVNALPHKKGQERFISFTRATNRQCQDLLRIRRVRALAD